MSDLAAAGAALLGGTLRRADAMAGGDLSQVLHIRLADGREAVVKGGPAPAGEAEMLGAIAASGAPAPRVLAVSDAVLVLEVLPSGGSLYGAWHDLGGVLARLHAATGPCYGWHAPFGFGGVAIDNTPCDTWPAFWAQRRLLPHAPHLPARFRSRIENLAARLDDLLPRQPAPLLLHGDLWGGNVLVAGTRISGLIDPACYYGHGEVDIAMLGLFDRPSAAFFDAYGALAAGSEARLPIYRLWPALVHVRLFGTGYLAMVDGLLARVGF